MNSNKLSSFRDRQMNSSNACRFLVLVLISLWLPNHVTAQQPRTWTDSTGKFQVTATLIEVKDGAVFLQSANGKTLKIPVERLCEADQKFLTADENPFEMVAPDAVPADTPAVPTPVDNRTSASAWSNPPDVNWDNVRTLDKGFGESEWSYTPPQSNRLTFEPKRTSLPSKANFFEGMRRLEINPLAARAAVGYTWTFSTPKHKSRVSLIDLPSGKAINSDHVECNMCPLTVLNDGKSILMHGTGGDRDGYETGDQLQIWTLSGRQVTRSATWIPFKDEGKSFGKTVNGSVSRAIPIAGNRILLMAGSGHLACVGLHSLQPIWHERLSRNHSIELTTDRKELFVLNEQVLMHLDPFSGEVKGSIRLEGNPQLGWTKMRLNAEGDQMLLSYTNSLRVIDLKTAETVHQYTRETGGVLSPNGLSYPAPDYALLNNNLLFHIPSGITVCDYKDAAAITSVGGVEFVGLLGDGGGVVAPTQIPHARAVSLLEQAVDDPSVFLIHPGVSVSLDSSAVPGNYRAEVEKNIREAIDKAGYKLSNGAPIKIKASVTGPKTEAVSYIARGAYVANVYTSGVSIEHQGAKIWNRTGSNIPMMLSTKRGQSIQERLDELGKGPSLSFFQGVALPRMMQAPTKSSNGNNQNALLVSKFTLTGIVDAP